MKKNVTFVEMMYNLLEVLAQPADDMKGGAKVREVIIEEFAKYNLTLTEHQLDDMQANLTYWLNEGDSEGAYFRKWHILKNEEVEGNTVYGA